MRMLSHIGSVLPSSLRDLSKSIASVLDLGPIEIPGETKTSPPPNTPPIDDVDVLLSYYAHSAEHRPSSRLLKGRGSKGSRGAKLLVPGSPAFERPWRVPGKAARGDHTTPPDARHDKARSSSAPTFSAAAQPKAAAASTGGLFLCGRVENSKHSRSNRNVCSTQKCDEQPRGQQQYHHHHHHHHQRQPSEAEALSQTATAHGIYFSSKLVGGRREEKSKPAGPGIDESQPLPQLQLAEAVTTAAEKSGTARAARGSLDDDTHTKSESTKNIAACYPQDSENLIPKRPSTSPALFEDLLHLSNHEGVGADRGVQESLPASAAREEPAAVVRGGDAARPSLNGNTSHRSAGSAGRSDRPNNDIEGTSFGHAPQLRERGSPQETRPRDTFAKTSPTGDYERLTATSIFDTEINPADSPVSLRPSTADAQRRSSIEADATLSRSSRLPPPSCSLSLGSEGGFTLLAGSTIGGLGHGGGDGGGGRSAQGAGEHPTATATSADIGRGGDSIAIIVGLTSPSPRTRSSGRKSGFQSSRDAGGSSGGGGGGGSGGGGRDSDQRAKPTTNRRFRRQRGGKCGQPYRQRHRRPEQQASAAASGGSFHGETSVSILPGSQISAAGTSTATGTTWTQWRRPGDLGELDLEADSAYSTNRRGGRRKVLGRATNGAAAGVGWGGHDQMMRVAAAPKASRFVERDRHETLSADPADERRPDTRERFYDAPVEHLKTLHPCSRCFDALMQHLRGGQEGQALSSQTSWSSDAARRDPHVALFVRWESLDKDLGRYIPRGFVGSFTPRPFRPALAEYAVKAAHDPKFWGLGWAQIPDTRCRVIVVKSLEVAQHERDWLSNRHGLILSFEDAAGRHHQAAVFPEMMCKAGWDKEGTIDALYRKAGYRGRRPRTDDTSVPSPAAAAAAPRDNGGGGTATVAAAAADDHGRADDPVVSRTAVLLRFETVSFRMEFCKYRRAKAAAARVVITRPQN